MGQQEVYEFLQHNAGRWYTSRDIACSLDISIGSVTMSLKKLRTASIILHRTTGDRNTLAYSMKKQKGKVTA